MGASKRQRLTVAEAHRQAMLAAAMVAAEIRGEADTPMRGACADAWYTCADKIARRLTELADKPPASGAPDVAG